MFLFLLAFFVGVPLSQAGADPFDVSQRVERPAVSCGVSENQALTFADVLALALCRNPATRETYAGAMASAADWGASRSSYLPTLNLTAGVAQSSSKTEGMPSSDSSSASARLSFQWLVYDFGGRSSVSKAAEESLNAALYTRSDTLQSLIFDTAEAYFSLFSAIEEHRNSAAALTSARETFKAANKRFELGLAAYSDKLQAETNVAQAELAVTKAEAAEVKARGDLMTLLDFDPNETLDFAEPVKSVDMTAVREDFNELMAQALEKRADIAAQKAKIAKLAADIVYQESRNAPTITLDASANAGREFSGRERNNYGGSVGLNLNVPLFTGFSNTYKISKARFALDESKAVLKRLENKLKNELWATYKNYTTARKSYEIALTMTASAQQSADVALGAYKAGRGDILKVLDTQAALADVRSTKSRSFYDLLIAKADLIRKAGLINPFQNEGFLKP